MCSSHSTAAAAAPLPSRISLSGAIRFLPLLLLFHSAVTGTRIRSRDEACIIFMRLFHRQMSAMLMLCRSEIAAMVSDWGLLARDKMREERAPAHMRPVRESVNCILVTHRNGSHIIADSPLSHIASIAPASPCTSLTPNARTMAIRRSW